MNTHDETIYADVKHHYNSRNYHEAKQCANQTLIEHPDAVNAWWYLCLSQCALGEHEEAHNSILEVLELAPDFANGWFRYGQILQNYIADENDETVLAAFETAVKLDPINPSSLTSLSSIYRRLNEEDECVDRKRKEIHVLELLDEVEGLTPTQLNHLGILHYEVKNFFDAIKYWERNVSAPGGFSLFNLGLAFNHREVSQDADAIDIWRMLLEDYPEKHNAKKQINNLLPRLLQLAKDSHKFCDTILPKKNFYDIYINPFELLNFDCSEIDLSDFDFKDIQRKRKRLLQEIELEDGKLYWLDDYAIDKSTAIGLCDELHDEKKRRFHGLVFSNKPLLYFLTKGKHKQFCICEESSPISLIRILDDPKSGFKDWLTPYFVKQFDRVLSIAIKECQLEIIEVLLDGRRWISQSYTEDCFLSSKKLLNEMLRTLEALDHEAEHSVVTASHVKNTLEQNSLLPILNLMPSFFWEQQHKAIKCVRNIAVAAYNEHGNSKYSKEIINLTALFEFKSGAFDRRLKDDIEAINTIIQRERESEVHLTLKSGTENFSITKEGVTRGSKFINSDSLLALKFGTTLVERRGREMCESTFTFLNNDQSSIVIEHSFQSGDQRGEKVKEDMIHAIMDYLIPPLISNFKLRLNNGSTVTVGDASVSKTGILYTTGLIFKKENCIGWEEVNSQLINGELIITSTKRRLSLCLPLKSTFNAFALHILIQEKKNK